MRCVRLCRKSRPRVHPSQPGGVRDRVKIAISAVPSKQLFAHYVQARTRWRDARCTEWHLCNVAGRAIGLSEAFLVVKLDRRIDVYCPTTSRLLYSVACDPGTLKACANSRWLVVANVWDEQGARVWDLTSYSSVFYGRRILPRRGLITAMHFIDRDRCVPACMPSFPSVVLAYSQCVPSFFL